MALLLNKQDKEEIVKLSETMTSEQLARKYNCSIETIRETLRNLGVKLWYYENKIVWNESMDEYILTDKRSIAEKSMVLNVSTSSIKNRLRVLRNKK